MTVDTDFEKLRKLAVVLSNFEAHSESCQISRNSVKFSDLSQSVM